MANAILSYPNRAANFTYSAVPGAFAAALPVTYLSTRRLSQVARTMTPYEIGTWCYAVASSAITASVFSFENHNFSFTGQVRIRRFAADPRPTYDYVFNQTVVPSGVTYSRGSVAWSFNAAGLLIQSAINTPRIYYSGGLPRGWLLEPARTNHLLRSRDGTAGWTIPSGSFSVRTLTATGIDGVANSATRLQASAINSRLVQGPLAIAAATRQFSIYLRRVTGSGTIRISTDNFTTNTVVVLTTAWQRFTLQTTASNPTVGVQIDTNGDAIEFDCAQVEDGSYATTPIVTTSATVTRSADVHNIALTGMATNYSFVVRGRILVNAGIGADLCTHLKDGSNYVRTQLVTSGSGIIVSSGGVNQGTTSIAATPLDTDTLVAVSVNTNDVRAVANNGTVGQDTTVTLPTAATSVVFGDLSAAVTQAVVIERYRLYNGVNHTSANLGSLTDSATGMEIAAAWDSGWLDVWPAAWLAATADEERVGVRGHSVHVVNPAQSGQYWRFDVKDESNTAGYLQWGRIHAGPTVQLEVNMNYGASISYESRDLIVEHDSGSESGVSRPAPRIVPFTVDHQSEAFAMNELLEAQRQLGTWGELFFIWDPNDTTHLPRRAFPARIRKPSPLTLAKPFLWNTSFEMRELL